MLISPLTETIVTTSGYIAFEMPEQKYSETAGEKLILLSEWLVKNIGGEFLMGLADNIKSEAPGRIIIMSWQLTTQPSPYTDNNGGED